MSHKPVEYADTSATRFGKDLTTGSIGRHLILFSLPMLIGSALQTAYGFVNMFWVGRYLGVNAMTAVVNNQRVVFVLMPLAGGLTMATNIIISQLWGAKDLPEVRRVARNSTTLVGVISLALVVVGELLAPAILRLINTPDDCFDMACTYMRIFMLSLPMGFGLFLVRNSLQGIGDSTTPLYFLVGSVLLNAALDPLLMFGWLGMPKLGLNGTAWAALIAQGLALAALVFVLRRRKNVVAPALSLRDFDWHTSWLTIKIGMPSALQHAFIAGGMLTVMGIVNSFGKNAAAAYGVASQIDMLAFMPAMSFGMAASTLAGQNIGANCYHRIRDILTSGCLLGGAVTAVASILVVSMPRLILSVFTTDPTLLDIGTDYLRIVGACYVFFGIMFISNGIINGSGHTMVATVISLVSQWGIRVPLAYALSKWMGRVEGVWYAMSISFGISMASSMAYYFTGLWRRPVIKHRPIPSTEAALLGEEGGEA